MPRRRPASLAAAREAKFDQAGAILEALEFGPRQRNNTARYVLLALAAVTPQVSWSAATAPLMGITPMMDWIAANYGVKYAPNTRETVRDEAVKHFVAAGMLVRNADDPSRPTNSGRTVYCLEPHALELLRKYGTEEWPSALTAYLQSRTAIVAELQRERSLHRVEARLPSGELVSLSPGGQNPLIKRILEDFCPIWVRSGVVLYIGDAENKWLHFDRDYLARLGVAIDSAEKIPDVVVHDVPRNWLVLVEAVTSAGPVDSKRRSELKQLFANSSAGLVFVTAFANREDLRTFVTQISWETEVWIADDPTHVIHFDGERYFAPYDDAMPENLRALA
uniref:Restriction endonuclease n=1 Tax=Schlesneria paludicola TaxID=360056 RepID=A0A7C2NX72_9PLAN